MVKISKNEKFWLSISHKCNNQCIFCHDKDNQVKGIFKRLEEVKAEIEMAKKEGFKRLILSGGEASINPDFLKIVKYAEELGFKEIQTITNGRYFYYLEFAKEAISAGLTEVTFSLHGHNEKLHDFITGVPGSFKQALTGLANVRQYPQIIVNIDIVINKLNYQQLYDIIQFFAQNFGVYEFDLLQIIPFGRAWENRHELLYNLDEARPYLEKVWELAKNDKRFHIWTNRFPAQYLEGYEFLIQDPVKMFDDVLGREKLLGDYLNNDVMMTCYDQERCQYCNLHDFCAKLIKVNELLKNSQDIRVEINKMSKMPDCINFISTVSPEINFIDDNHKINLEKFVDFYIDNLYNVKSLRCQECKNFNNCNGLNINLIREKGFKVLKPIYDEILKD